MLVHRMQCTLTRFTHLRNRNATLCTSASRQAQSMRERKNRGRLHALLHAQAVYWGLCFPTLSQTTAPVHSFSRELLLPASN